MQDSRHNIRDVFPATGTEITAKSWLTEAPLRMLMNNLHPDVAENPHALVVYGGIGRAARTWEDFDRIVEPLSELSAAEKIERHRKELGTKYKILSLTDIEGKNLPPCVKEFLKKNFRKIE